MTDKCKEAAEGLIEKFQLTPERVWAWNNAMSRWDFLPGGDEDDDHPDEKLDIAVREAAEAYANTLSLEEACEYLKAAELNMFDEKHDRFMRAEFDQLGAQHPLDIVRRMVEETIALQVIELIPKPAHMVMR